MVHNSVLAFIKSDSIDLCGAIPVVLSCSVFKRSERKYKTKCIGSNYNLVGSYVMSTASSSVSLSWSLRSGNPL